MSDKPVESNLADASNASARQKTLQLGKLLGLASDADYRASNASILERAQHREQKQTCQHQHNVENIFALALNYTPSDVTGADLDPDWRYQFFSLAQQIHNRKMQDLWARILASEVVNPGLFSLRTLNVLTQLTIREAQLFEKALSMSVKVNQESRYKLLTGYRVTGGLKQYFRPNSVTTLNLSQFGLPYSSILTLADAGILHKSEFETGLLANKTPVVLNLHDQTMTLTPKSPHLLFSYYRFTTVGDELGHLIQTQFDSHYMTGLKAFIGKDFS